MTLRTPYRRFESAALRRLRASLVDDSDPGAPVAPERITSPRPGGIDPDKAEAIIRRMIATGYNPAAAVMDALGVDSGAFARAWAAAHDGAKPSTRDYRWLVDLATRITGTAQRRPASAIFELTQLAFGKGEVALTPADAREVRAALARARDEGIETSEFVDYAIARLTRAILAELVSDSTEQVGGENP
jgi:hypothetical protein